MNKMRRNIISQYGLQIAKYLFPFITLPYLTRVLGPDVYAVRAYVLAAMTFMQVFLDYGFTLFGTKTIAEHSEDITKVQTDTSSIAFLRLLLCFVGALVLACITPFLPIMAENSLYVALAYIGVCFKATLPDFVFQGQEDMGIITQRFVVSQTASTILIFGLIHKPSDLILVPIFEAVASLIAFVWSWDNVLRIRHIALIRVSGKILLHAFKESSIFFLSNVATTAFNAFTTLMIGVYVSDHAQISYWSIAMTAVTAVQSLYTPITNSLYPHMVKSRDIRLFRRFLFVGTIIVTIGTILFALLSKVIMLLLGGQQYIPGSYIIVLLSPVVWLSFGTMILGFPLLGAIGKIRELTASSVISALFHVAGLLILGLSGQFSIVAVAALRCCTELVMFILRTVFALRSAN